MGIAIYFTGFFVEEPYQRWNLSTFIDSCLNAFLIGIIPFLFFTIINFRSFRTYHLSQTFVTDPDSIELKEEKIQINSKLKKERLSFLPGQFCFAMSDGNYVIFYLNRNNKIEKEIIRNSIGNIEKQLSSVSFFMRTHRAFIVNVKKVHIKNGNTSGYHLKISDIDMEIPVSRQYAQDFIQLFNQFE
jgi:DNA-binding LytR/AlgR family response regulator